MAEIIQLIFVSPCREQVLRKRNWLSGARRVSGQIGTVAYPSELLTANERFVVVPHQQQQL